jgi:hypothetical protein
MKTSAVVLLVTGLVVVHAPALHASLFISIAANSATVDINEAGASQRSFVLEYEINDSIVDADPSSYYGSFPNAIVGGKLSVNGSAYTLAGPSASGTINLADFSRLGPSSGLDGDRVVISPLDGGSVIFTTGDDKVFSSLFADCNSLASAVAGSVINNTASRTVESTSQVNFPLSPPMFVPPFFFSPGFDARLHTTTGDLIALVKDDPPAAGNLTLAVSRTPAIGVPEPGTFLLGSLGAAGLLLAARRRSRGPFHRSRLLL